MTQENFLQLPMGLHKSSCCNVIHDPPGERTPGPADYKSDSKRILPGKPAYTIAGRHSQGMHKSTTPGPGAYAVRSNSKVLGSHPNAPGYSMPSSSRGSELGHKVPGPGGRSSMLCYVATGFLCQLHAFMTGGYIITMCNHVWYRTCLHIEYQEAL